MTDNRKTTVPGASVGADAVQSSDKITTNIITNSDKQINLQAAKKSNNFGLNTISMTELYDTVYQPRKPIVNDLLYSGTYLFVGAPKVGKSFFMGQLAYHVAMGLPMWEYEVHQGTVLYLALEDDYARLQRRLSRTFCRVSMMMSRTSGCSRMKPSNCWSSPSLTDLACVAK